MDKMNSWLILIFNSIAILIVMLIMITIFYGGLWLYQVTY